VAAPNETNMHEGLNLFEFVRDRGEAVSTSGFIHERRRKLSPLIEYLAGVVHAA
jgi:hypothetical protein